MKEEIWTAYYHKSSTDENVAQKLRKSEAAGSLNSFQHSSPPLNLKVVKKLESIHQGYPVMICLNGAWVQKHRKIMNPYMNVMGVKIG